ncbi:MAG: hypothetical protein KDC92_00220 [Bacteroidetes bacterium]|nr:hypothetical protein [Bacteroidota bacterium]
MAVLTNAFTVEASDTLVLKKQSNGAEQTIRVGKLVKVKLLSGQKIKGELIGISNNFIVVGADTVQYKNVEWITRQTFLRPLGIALATGGTGIFLFGTAGFLSSVGSDDTWAQLGAVIGALIAVTGGIIDLAALPMLMHARKFRLNGERANWQVE